MSEDGLSLFISRSQALAQGNAPSVTLHKGASWHFLSPHTGDVKLMWGFAQVLNGLADHSERLWTWSQLIKCTLSTGYKESTPDSQRTCADCFRTKYKHAKGSQQYWSHQCLRPLGREAVSLEEIGEDAESNQMACMYGNPMTMMDANCFLQPAKYEHKPFHITWLHCSGNQDVLSIACNFWTVLLYSAIIVKMCYPA